MQVIIFDENRNFEYLITFDLKSLKSKLFTYLHRFFHKICLLRAALFLEMSYANALASRQSIYIALALLCIVLASCIFFGSNTVCPLGLDSFLNFENTFLYLMTGPTSLALQPKFQIAKTRGLLPHGPQFQQNFVFML